MSDDNHYDQNNIFWKIINKQSKTDIIFENDYVIAFPDIFPCAPVHVLIIPKAQFISMQDFSENAPATVIAEFFRAVSHVAKLCNVHEDGYRLITNCGANAQQTVPHFHCHMLGGRDLGRKILIND